MRRDTPLTCHDTRRQRITQQRYASPRVMDAKRAKTGDGACSAATQSTLPGLLAAARAAEATGDAGATADAFAAAVRCVRMRA